MSIALRNFNGVQAAVQRIEKENNLRMLVTICGMIAAPSLVLLFFLSGWLQYMFVAGIAINIAVPVMSYLVSRKQLRALPDEEQRRKIVFEEATLPVMDRIQAEKITDKV